MRVTHVITRLVIGGAQENTISTVLGLQGRPGLQTNLISGPTEGPEGSLEPLVSGKSELLTIVPSLVRPISPWHDARAWRELTRIFRAARPDIVHTHSGKAGALGRLAAHRAGVQIIIHTIHGPSFGAFQGASANALFTAVERRAGRVTTHFVSVADAMTRQYLAAGIGRPEQYTRIFSGFALEPFLQISREETLRQNLGMAPSDIVVAMVARLFKLKGHDDLIDAAPELLRGQPHFKFLLVGDGAWRARLEKRVGSLGLASRFVFVGLVKPEEIPRYLGAADIVLHLSRREGLARVLPQALATGRPIVALDFDGAAEVCLENETGFLAQPGQWMEPLLRLAADPARRERMGRRGREFAAAHFSVETMVESLYTLYRRLAQNHGIPG